MFFYGVMVKKLLEIYETFFGFGDDEETAGIAIEAVDDTWTFVVVTDIV